LRNFDHLPRIRSERPAFDEKYGYLVSDLGHDLPQRETKPRQTLAEELRPDRHPAPETDHPSAEGASGPPEASEHHPPPDSGARPVTVPQPEEVGRPDYDERSKPDNPIDSERGGRETNKRWRTGKPSDEGK
jgi:cytochrome c oxidase subunit 1